MVPPHALMGECVNKGELRNCLAQEIEKWARKSFCDLREGLKERLTYSVEAAQGTCDVQVTLLEITDTHVRVRLGVDDRSTWRSIFPLTRDVIVYNDGRVDQ